MSDANHDDGSGLQDELQHAIQHGLKRIIVGAVRPVEASPRPAPKPRAEDA